MSIIGPRPLLVRYLPYYTENERHRHDVTVLCTNPTIFRWQRNFMIKMKIIKGDWV